MAGLVTKRNYQFDGKLKLPTASGNQSSPADRDFWIDTNSGKLGFRLGGATILVPLASEISSGFGTSDTSTVDLTLADGTLTAAVLDSPKLEGNTLAQVQAAIIASITAGASSAYDTLLEIQNLLQADDTAMSGLTTAVGVRARFWAGVVPSGSPTANVDHNLNLTNIHDFIARVVVAATGAEEEYDIVGNSANRVVVTDESGASIAAGRRIFLTAGV